MQQSQAQLHSISKINWANGGTNSDASGSGSLTLQTLETDPTGHLLSQGGTFLWLPKSGAGPYQTSHFWAVAHAAVMCRIWVCDIFSVCRSEFWWKTGLAVQRWNECCSEAWWWLRCPGQNAGATVEIHALFFEGVQSAFLLGKM